MKLFSFLLIFLIASISSFSQVKQEQEKSKLETFSEKSGNLIQKTFIDIGKIKDMEVQVLTLENVTDNTKINGLRFSSYSYSSLGSDSKISFLDKDEVDGLLKSLKYFSETVFSTNPENYTEFTFSSRSGLSASVYQDNKKKWNTVLQLEKYDRQSKVYVKQDELISLISLIEKAKEKLM